MNPKIEKLKAERSRNTEKISDLQNRNRKLSEQIAKLENNDIIGMVREIGMTPEQLARASVRQGCRICPEPMNTKKRRDMNMRTKRMLRRGLTALAAALAMMTALAAPAFAYAGDSAEAAEQQSSAVRLPFRRKKSER